MPQTPIEVTLTVKVGDVTETFETVTATNTNPYDVAQGLVTGVRDAARTWINKADWNATHP